MITNGGSSFWYHLRGMILNKLQRPFVEMTKIGH